MTLVRVQPREDAWQTVVGIPIDDWRSALTGDEFVALIARREAGEFSRVETFEEHRAECRGATVDLMAFGEGHVRTMCACGASFAHV